MAAELPGTSHPLSASERSFFEPRFGRSFAHVRIHEGRDAADSAGRFGALAYTLGSHIVFGDGQYAPATASGRTLLAHELAHTAQSSEGVSRNVICRQSVQMASGRFVGDAPGAINNLREEVLQAMDRLHMLWSMTDAEYGAEYPTITALPAGSAVGIGSIPKTIAALRRNADASMAVPVAQQFLGLTLTAPVGTGQTNNKSDVLAVQDALHQDWFIGNAEYASERAAINAVAGPTVSDATIPHLRNGLRRMKEAAVTGIFRRDVFAGTHAVTPTEHREVEAILNPGSSIVGGSVVLPPAMTGAGVGGSFEVDMLASLDANVNSWATGFRTLRAAGPPSFPIASANTIATAAQNEAERYFRPYIQSASRQPADLYHPGAFNLQSVLGDQSTRPLDNTYSPSGRRGWTAYWMTLTSCDVAPCPQAVLNSHHCLRTRPAGPVATQASGPDQAEFDRVLDLFAVDPARRTNIDDAIHSWPAEAGSGTVFIQPYQQAGNPTQVRKNRWDVFTTLLHEMMHKLAHPNYEATSTAIGGTAQKILTEGMADVMRHDLWDGPGQLVSRIGSAQLSGLRTTVEGGGFGYDPAVVEYHPDYDEVAEARSIATRVGMPNAKAAFFLGHTDLLGLGAGTHAASSLAGIAEYSATESRDAELFVAAAGDTLASIETMTNTAPGIIRNFATGVAIPPGSPIAPGKRLRVPGIAWTRIVAGDTLGSIAGQHHVTVPALIAANRLPVATAATFAPVPGTRFLIPIHQNLL